MPLTSGRVSRWPTWLCALSPVAGLAAFGLTTARLRWELGRWPTDAIERLNGLSGFVHGGMIVAMGFALFAAPAAWLGMQLVPRLRSGSRRAVQQAVAWLVGHLLTMAVIYGLLPATWVTWFND